jgi:hypothetical protein
MLPVPFVFLVTKTERIAFRVEQVEDCAEERWVLDLDDD